MLATSLDGQWALVRRGREALLLERGAVPAVGRLDLPSDDVELAFVGPPAVLVAIERTPAPRIVLHQPPYLEAVARHELEQPMRLAAITGPRLALVADDKKAVTVVRVAGRGLAAQPLDVGSAVELAVGLDRNQLLFGLHKKLEVWDAVSARPLLRLQLQLPPPPRTVGAAQGHLWCARAGTDEIHVYRLSDGRPFRHQVGATVQDVIAHPASPVVVLVTPRGLVRLHCFAHSLTAIDAPWAPGMSLALLVAGDDVDLLGLPDGETTPWRVPVGPAPAAPAPDEPAEASATGVTSALEKLRELRERAGGPGVPPAPVRPIAAPPIAAPPTAPLASGPRPRTWRDALAAFALEVGRGADAEVPVVPVDCELGELAHRLGLSAGARHALTVLYALYLVGEPAPSIARLAHVLGDWTEPLGQGELAAHDLVDRTGGRVALRPAITDALDGARAAAER